MNHAGFYWGGQTILPIDSVARYNVSNVSLALDLHQPSNSQILNNVGVSIDYLFNNHQRTELLIKSSILLEIEKALKKYIFNLNFDLINTDFKNANNDVLVTPTYNRVASIRSMNGSSDMLFKSNFLVSGTKIFDYKLGIDFQYFPGDDIQYGGDPLVFPSIHLSHTMSDNEKIELNLSKDLTYHPFNKLFDLLPYVDPYYQNSLSKEFKIDVSYHRRLGRQITVASNLNYIRDRGQLIPFIFFERGEVVTLEELSVAGMGPVGVFRDQLQQGFLLSSSLSYNTEKYNFLIEYNWNTIQSRTHENKQFLPQFEINSILTLHILKNTNMVANCYYKGSQDVLRIANIYDPTTSFNYSELSSYLNINVSLNYSLDVMVFSLDFKNILNQDQYFFDEYYDDDGFKISLGFLYKF
tara:strand:+ start:169 stop:1401 length:1233 start_codon:yes stop_codon:yes gene_type:complete